MEASFEYCRRYFQVRQEHQSAAEYARLEQLRVNHGAEILRLKAAGAARKTDPQAGMLVRLSRGMLELAEAQLWLNSWAALVVEMGAALIPVVATGHGFSGGRRRRRERNDEDAQMSESVAPARAGLRSIRRLELAPDGTWQVQEAAGERVERTMDHYVVSVGGQKGGTGKSTVAQGIAVEAARTGGIVMLADLDLKQATSAEWAKRRKAAGHRPAIEARLISQRQVWELQALCNLLVIDAPGYADNSTLELAQRSDLLVLTTGTNLIELEPTVLLTRELMAKGIPQEKVAIALVKVIDREREKEARAYLKDAKLAALEPALGWYKAVHDIGTDGRAVTESPNRAVAGQGAAFFGGIAGALERVTQPEKHKRRSVAVAEATRERGGRERG